MHKPTRDTAAVACV